MINIINDSDQIVLESVESFLSKRQTPIPASPQEKLYMMQIARDELYSNIADRVPRIASYIMKADMENDQIAKGLFLALSKHAVDPVFIQIVMQKLAQRNIQEENGIVGALLAKIMDKLIKDKQVTAKKPVQVEKKSDKDKTTAVKQEEPVVENTDDLAHLYNAIQCLLGNIASIVATRCGNVTMAEAITIAACIVMDNDDTIKELIASDLPISAQILDILANPKNVLISALKLNKADYTKLTNNQSNFIETLKKWVYERMNALSSNYIVNFVTAVYGSIKPDPAVVSMKLIQLKDCGTQYSNLLMTVKTIINN